MEKLSPEITTENIKKTAEAAIEALKTGAIIGAAGETAQTRSGPSPNTASKRRS